MGEEKPDLIDVLVKLRDCLDLPRDAINFYLEAKAPPEIKIEKIEELFPDDLRAKHPFGFHGLRLVRPSSV